ncbi:pentatricopeptide repeat-containing protein [Tanacetum coccineum]
MTVVGRDGNNHIFPVAWAVVAVENKDNWSWFLDLLADDLEVPNGNGLTLISDQHKTLRHGQELTSMKACAVKQLRMGLVNVSTQFWFWHVIPCGGNLFEVKKGSEAFRVDEPKRTCSCRMWQLLGLLFCHAIACIFRLNRMVEGHLSTVLCPKPKRMPGKRKKKRIKVSHEPKFSTTKISRAGAIMTCYNCWEKGHNKSTYKKDPIPVIPKEKGTQQSQVLPTTQESTRTERPITRRVVAEQMLQPRSEGIAQRQAKQRQPSNFVPSRKKSERLKNLKVAEAVTQGGSTDNVIGQ